MPSLVPFTILCSRHMALEQAWARNDEVVYVACVLGSEPQVRPQKAIHDEWLHDVVDVEVNDIKAGRQRMWWL
jgi:hypothetical protein